jgi:outer membrane protein assembly factor BamA
MNAGWDRESFLGERDRLMRAGVDVVFDTRIDPMLPRNAVYARAAWDRLAFERAVDTGRTDLEARAYVGLPAQSIIVLRALRQDSDQALPRSLSPIFGGTASLRGLRAGSAVGDTLVAGSVELRLPLTSPLSVGKLGVSAFVDTGTVHGQGQRLGDREWERGAGGGVWFSAAFLRLNAYVARTRTFDPGSFLNVDAVLSSLGGSPWTHDTITIRYRRRRGCPGRSPAHFPLRRSDDAQVL